MGGDFVVMVFEAEFPLSLRGAFFFDNRLKLIDISKKT